MTKNLLFLFLSISALSFAQKNDAKLYFKNGQVRTGKADMVLNSETKVRFKGSEGSKTEKIKFDDLSKIEYFESASDNPIIFERREIIWRKGKPRLENVWLSKIDDGEIKYYISKNFYDGSTNMSTGNTMTPTTFTSYYFQYQDQKPEMIYYLIDKRGVKNQKEILGYLDPFFKNICPNLIQEYKNGNLKLIKDPKPLLDYYNQNCRKQD